MSGVSGFREANSVEHLIPHPEGCDCRRCQEHHHHQAQLEDFERHTLHHHHIDDIDELEHAETELAWEEVPDK